MTAQTPRKQLIIIGAGFAGLTLAKALRDAPLDILVVDKQNYHLFQPLLYQVATAALSPADIAYPIRRVFRAQPNVTVALGAVERIDLAQHQVCSGRVCVDFDYLAVCVGATHSYFGHDGAWAKVAPGLKTLDDATEIRRRVLLAFEAAEFEDDAAARRATLTFVIVGGGPTGVELAGALREIAADELQKDFRHIDTRTSRVILVQGADRLLPQFPPDLGERARRDLEAMGVEVRLGAHVTAVDDTGVWIGTEQLPAQNVLWAAGVAAPTMLKTMGVPTDHVGRIVVGPDLAVPGHPQVFVVGDAAAAVDGRTGQPVPGLAAAAIQMGRYVAAVIREDVGVATTGLSSTARVPFHYRDKGIMATIGKRRAVAALHGVRLTGWAAWVVWSLVHILVLIGFRNKLLVMVGWIADYLLHELGARLITGSFSVHIRAPRRGAHVHVQPAGSAPAPAPPPPVLGTERAPS